jgi:hypothetical protein
VIASIDPAPLFVFQFVWFLAAWSVIAALFAAPVLRRYAVEDALAICLIPQLFRVLGIGLLVPNLAPGMPHEFALPTAIGDSTTAILAMLAVIALRQRWSFGRNAAWACTIVGVADLAIALPHAAAIGAAQYLTAQWYVPALGVPFMIVSHAMALRILLSSRGTIRASPTS